MKHGFLKKLANCKVVSFDIFDTLVVRKCKEPKNVFELVENRFEQMHGHQTFSFEQIRIMSEAEARKNKNGGEVFLEDIYQVVSKYIGKELSSILMSMEFETELDVCEANKDIVNLYQAISKSKDVFMVSDMYLGIERIKSILSSCNIPQPKRLYISCEVNASKRNRELYKLLMKENNLRARDILHIGDNFISDYINPKLLGMQSVWVRR